MCGPSRGLLFLWLRIWCLDYMYPHTGAGLVVLISPIFFSQFSHLTRNLAHISHTLVLVKEQTLEPMTTCYPSEADSEKHY